MSYCKQFGGALAIINDAKENSFVNRLISENGFSQGLIGLRHEEAEWKWVDGSALEYTNWNTDDGQAPSAKGFGGIDTEHGKWIYLAFRTDLCFVCEWD